MENIGIRAFGKSEKEVDKRTSTGLQCVGPESEDIGGEAGLEEGGLVGWDDGRGGWRYLGHVRRGKLEPVTASRDSMLPPSQ